MRILMVAPEPVLEPRGTPLLVYHRARVLSQLGHTVDLATYPVGQSFTLPGVHIYRTWPLPGLRRVKVGPSLAKLLLDGLLLLRVIALVLRRRYDCIHTYQEAGLIGAICSYLWRLPHIYDMQSSLPEELANFRFTRNRLLVWLMHQAERIMVRSARTVIVVYPELLDIVAAIDPAKPVTLIYCAIVEEEDEQDWPPGMREAALCRLRQELGVPEGTGLVLLYTGTFEPYQGLDLLIAAMPEVLAAFPTTLLLLVGGHPEQVAALAEQARRLGVAAALRLPGRRDPKEIPLFMDLADVLLSPRSQGTNTPLKIYTYLHAGKPILATTIRAHTQVLPPDAALLVEPTSSALAQGIKQLLADPALRARLGQRARTLARQRYSYATFRAQTAQAYRIGLHP
jgi:glycosyltransferase involved in cell wall biosynthesis